MGAANILNHNDFLQFIRCRIKRHAPSSALEETDSAALAEAGMTLARSDFTVDTDFADQLSGKRLAVTEVIYYMPACPALLQSFVWQTLDQAPDFPRIHRFLDYWRREIDAVIHSVTISGGKPGLIAPVGLRTAHRVGQLN
jgi:uncharacterized protein Usg